MFGKHDVLAPKEKRMLDSGQDGFAKLVSKIEALEVGMLTTFDDNGNLRSRPMTTQRLEDGALWFFTDDASPKVEELHHASAVNVSYADPVNQVYVSVSGSATTHRDPHKVRALWNPGAQRWFPEGPDDPRIALLKVEIVEAEYWDVDARTMKRLLAQGGSADDIIAATDHRKIS